MIGDKLVITNYHRQAAAKISPHIQQALNSPEDTIAVSIAEGTPGQTAFQTPDDVRRKPGEL